MKIIPLFNPNPNDLSFGFHLQAVSESIANIYPEGVPQQIETKVIWEKQELTLGVTLICSKQNTLGVGRYMNDVCSRSLVPGKLVNLSSSYSMAFKIEGIENEGFFIHKVYATIETKNDLVIAEKNLQLLPQEIKLNIEAVRNLREIFSQNNLSIEEKDDLITKTIEGGSIESIHTLLGSNKESEYFSELTQNILKSKKISPDVFSREIFQELQQLIFSMKEEFVKTRSNEYISKVLVFNYLLRKSILLKEAQDGLQLELKFFKPYANKESTIKSLGILVVLKLKNPSENIDGAGIFDAIHAVLPDAKMLSGSMFFHYRHHEGIKTIYLEVTKEKDFDKTSISNLKKKLPFEIDERIFRPVLPIFMPRNEEEVMKHMILLSKELRYVDDIPQVMLNFYKQTPHTLNFTTIVVALNKGESLNIPIETIEKRNMGTMRGKYQKEGFVFELTIEKSLFIRKDRSIDLFEARKAASMRLLELIGPFRDYNGGLILKKSEILVDFKKLVKPYSVGSEILLERFFHSISPSYMQGVLQPSTLKKLFFLMLKATDTTFEGGLFDYQIYGDTLIVSMAIQDTNLKAKFKSSLDKLKIPTSQLAITHFDQYGVSVVGLILRHFEISIIDAIKNCFNEWILDQRVSINLSA
jgi:hypothetical protein